MKNLIKKQQLILCISACIPALALAQTQRGSIEANEMIAGSIFILILIAILAIFKIAKDRKRNELVKLLLEKGEKIPPELLAGSSFQASMNLKHTMAEQRRMMRSVGTLILCFGLGVSLVLYITSEEIRSAAWGLILIFTGIAFLINASFFPDGEETSKEQGTGQE
jgi:hypothetical protein